MTDINYEPKLDATQDMLTLVTWYADNGGDIQNILHIIEKPWHYRAEAVAAYLDIEADDFYRLQTDIEDDDGSVDDLIRELREFAASREA